MYNNNVFAFCRFVIHTCDEIINLKRKNKGLSVNLILLLIEVFILPGTEHEYKS